MVDLTEAVRPRKRIYEIRDLKPQRSSPKTVESKGAMHDVTVHQ